jgi:glycerol-3-phosphate O-acyltransferase
VLAAALRSFDGQAVPLAELLKRAKALSRILKNEFIYEPGRPFDSIVGGQLALLLRLGLAEKHGEPGHEIILPTAHGAERLTLLSELLRTFLEAAWLALDGLTMLTQPMDVKEWTRRLLDRGRAAFLAGRILRQESLSKALLDNALASLKERGVVAQGEGKTGKLARSPELASEEKLAAMAEEVDLFLR